MSISRLVGILALTTGSLLCPLGGQSPRPEVECGCAKEGAYVQPNLKQVNWNALASSQGTYTAEPWEGRLGVTIRKEGEVIENIGSFSDPIHWGFSPDEHRLIIHVGTPGGFDAAPIQHWCFLYDLQSPGTDPWESYSLVRSAHSTFSPNGKYLLYAALTGDSRCHLNVIEAASLSAVINPSFWAEPVLGSPGKKLGIAAWGFSPDPQDASFFYAFNDGGEVNANLYNLTSERRVVANWKIETDAEWRFSPCGDLFALTKLPGDASSEVWLLQTRDGDNLVSRARVDGPYSGLVARSDGHYVLVGSSQVSLNLANDASKPCGTVGEEAPFWPEGAVMNVQFVDDRSVRVAWSAADGNGSDLAGYEIHQISPEEVMHGYVSVDDLRRFTIEELDPASDYTFAVYAQNLAGMWTPDPLMVDAQTDAADDAPDWDSEAEIWAEEIGEDWIRLAWDAATDNEAVTQYEISRDGAVIATLPATPRTYTAEGLEIGERYRFRVQAGDAADQWTTDGPDVRVGTVDRSPPTWPEGSRVFARELTTTRIDLEWTEAIDNVEVVNYRIYIVRKGEPQLFAAVGSTVHFEFSCLRPNTPFHFKVEAGDDAGNWSTDGPSGILRTASGPLDCEEHLEVASVSSREEMAAGVWHHYGADWGRYNAAQCEDPAISADGRFVAFASSAVNLVPNDFNSHRLTLHGGGGFTETWHSDVFVRDRLSGTTERVSVSTLGAAAPVGKSSRSPALSGDGRYVVFVSSAPNLVDNDDNGTSDVFLRDRVAGRTVRIPELGFGHEANSFSSTPTISRDAQVIAFVSKASNLVSGDGNSQDDIFVYDRFRNELSRVSVSDEGTEGNGRSWGPALSADGRFVAFVSVASNLVPEDTNGRSDVFVHDRDTGATERVSVSSEGLQANNDSAEGRSGHPPDSRAAISADGRFVAFDSFASNLVPGDTNLKRDIFVHDRETGETHRVNLSSSGEEANWLDFSPTSWFGGSWEPSMSGDGRWVAFSSNAPNLVSDDGNDWTDIFLHDRETGMTERINTCGCGEGVTETEEWSASPAVSDDGQAIAFESHAFNLAPNLMDLNDSEDIFVYKNEYSPPDFDGDGTPDTDEYGPDGNDPDYDGNDDGIPDSEQDYVVSGHTLDRSGYLTSESTEGLRSIVLGGFFEPFDPSPLPDGVDLPFGALDLGVHEAVEPGGTLRIAVGPCGGVFNTYYSYGREYPDEGPHWFEFNFNGRTGAEIDGSYVFLNFIDGERGDRDLEANGTIVNLGGPTQLEGGTAPQLEVSSPLLEFPEAASFGSLELRNTGGWPLVWAVFPEDLPAWLTVTPAIGTLDPGQAARVQVRIDRTGLAAGALLHPLDIHSGGGTQTVEILVAAGLQLHFKPVADGSGSLLELSWTTEAEHSYRVQSQGQLKLGLWTDESPTLTAEGDHLSWVDALPVGWTSRFYRVVEE